MRRLALLSLAGLFIAAPVLGQPADPPPPEAEKQRDDALFGEGDAPEPRTDPVVPSPGQPLPNAATPTAGPPAPTKKANSDASDHGNTELGDARLTGEMQEQTDLLTRDRLQIGGLFYTRNGATILEGLDASDTPLSSSTLVDLYLDGRVNDRVRAYVRGRMTYDPLLNQPVTPATSGLASLLPQRDPLAALLDQAWLKFDVKRQVFLTLGKQHVRWGATRLWNPVDVINLARRDPLAFFDERTGIPMLKVHVPIESLGWNTYLLLLFDRADRLEKIGAALRQEIVLGQAELGLTGLARKGTDPKVGLDLSAAIWEFDVTGEFGLRFANEEAHWQASGGISWTWAFREDDSLTLALEYFHNPDGAPDERAPVEEQFQAGIVAFSGQPARPRKYLPFYTGRDYAALVAALISPGDWNDTSFSLVTISNLSDQSGTVRVDARTRILTDLSLEGYVGAFLGEGEFNAQAQGMKNRLGASPLTASFASLIHAPLFQVGVNLRVDL